MQRWQIHFLGRDELHDLTPFELRHFFRYSESEKNAIMARRDDRLRLGAALQLGFMKLSGRPLRSIDCVNTVILRHLGDALGIQVPHLASLKTLYSRRPTMFAHQKWARETLGFEDYTERRERVLVTYLREQAQHRETSEELVTDANVWLYERKILIPGARRILDVARTALLGVAQEHVRAVRQEVPAELLRRWEKALLRRRHGRTRFEWLLERPMRLSRKGTRLLRKKIDFLRGLDVHKYALAAIRIDKQRAYARDARRGRPARLMELPKGARAVSVACFLRVSLLQITDAVFGQFEMHAARLVHRASDVADQIERLSATMAKASIEKIRGLVEDQSLESQDLREQIRRALPPASRTSSHAAAVRRVLCNDARRVRPLLKDVLAVPLEHAAEAPVGKLVKRLKQIYSAGATTFPRRVEAKLGPPWDKELDGADRRRTLRVFEAATLEELRQSLQNGSIWSRESLRYREHESCLIPANEWHRSRERYRQGLGAPASAKNFIEKIEAAVQVGLKSVAEAVESGELEIRNGTLRLPALEAEDDAGPVCDEMLAELGSAGLPDVMVEIDSQVRFSWTLLGRSPHSTKELLAVYAALLAHGTDLSLAAVKMLVPGAAPDSVEAIMRALESEPRLRRANSAVVEFLRQHPIAETWGTGTRASADAMSLEASRHLWNARIDPRRRKHAIGMYTHVLDQWGIIYDQPIVLNQRQAGAAIEGVVRNTVAPNIEMLAVDTHGYTDFGMGLSKILWFDLCPRLKNLKHRHLYVTRGSTVPAGIREVCRCEVATEDIVAQWDALLRLAASIREGHVSAVHVLLRYGSAARGDAIYLAGTSLGRLVRTVFLCDYFTNETFRRELLRILNHGEAVHTLQRAIHHGGIGMRRGRHEGELLATSGSLSLLANIVMAWVTQRMQGVLDGWSRTGRVLSPSELEALRHTSPLHFDGLNFRGVMRFPIEEHASRLIDRRRLQLA